MAILDKYSYVFVEGIKWTLVLTVITVSLGAVLGTLVAFLKMGKNKVLNIIGYFYIEVIRGTPILLQMYFFWLWLPKLLGVNMSEKTSIIVALVVNSSAYSSSCRPATAEMSATGEMAMSRYFMWGIYARKLTSVTSICPRSMQIRSMQYLRFSTWESFRFAPYW